MPVGVGGLITDLMMGNPSAKLGAALAPPNPSPTGAPGPASAAPGVNPSAQAPGQPPAQTYAPDPQNASTIDLLLKVHKQDVLSNSINQGLAGMAAGFGTAQQQHDKLEAMKGITGDDTLAALGQAQKITDTAQQQAEHNKFMAGADLMGQTILHLQPGQGAWLANSGKLPEIMATHFRDMEPTDAMKNIEAWKTAARASGMSEEDINNQAATMLGGAVGGIDTATKEFNNAWAQARRTNKGKTDAQILAEHPELESPLKYGGAKAEEGKASALAAAEKQSAQLEFTKVDENYKTALKTIDNLLANPDATVAAVQKPQGLTTDQTGRWAGWLGDMGVPGLPTQDVLNAKGEVDQLKNELFASRFQGTKNVRNLTEANALAGSATNVFKSTNDRDTILAELKRLRDATVRAHATAIAAAGKQIPKEYRGKADPTFLDKSNPLYNGATEAPDDDSSSAKVPTYNPKTVKIE